MTLFDHNINLLSEAMDRQAEQIAKTVVKPDLNTVIINGLNFIKLPDNPLLNEAVYRNQANQYEVRIAWSHFFDGWTVAGRWGRLYRKYIIVKDLSQPFEMKESYFDGAAKIQNKCCDKCNGLRAVPGFGTFIPCDKCNR